MDPNNQSFPDFPTVDPPDFGGGSTGQTNDQQPDTGSASDATLPTFGGSGGGNGGSAQLGGGLGSLDSGGSSSKKRTMLILIGGGVAVVLSVLFVFLYFYFQDQGSTGDDFYTPPVQQPAQQPDTPAQTDEASPSADTGSDPSATDEASPADDSDLTNEETPATASAQSVIGDPIRFTESEYFTVELPENWEVQEATQTPELYLQQYDASITTEVGDESVQVGLVRFQVSDKILANQIDPDAYEIIEEKEVLVGGNSATQIEYQEKDSEDALPILNILTNDDAYSYRISFTVNPKYDNATAVRNAFIESLLTISFGSKSSSDPDETSDPEGPDAEEPQSIPEEEEEEETNQNVIPPDESSPQPVL